MIRRSMSVIVTVIRRAHSTSPSASSPGSPVPSTSTVSANAAAMPSSVSG